MAVILLVDDDEDSRRVLALLLERAGHVAIQTPAVPEAAAVLERLRPDLVILDIAMPDASGFDLLAGMTRDGGAGTADPPTIMLSAYDGIVYRELARRLGAADYFVKGGFEVGALLERVVELAGSAAVARRAGSTATPSPPAIAAERRGDQNGGEEAGVGLPRERRR